MQNPNYLNYLSVRVLISKNFIFPIFFYFTFLWSMSLSDMTLKYLKIRFYEVILKHSHVYSFISIFIAKLLVQKWSHIVQLITAFLSECSWLIFHNLLNLETIILKVGKEKHQVTLKGRLFKKCYQISQPNL